MVTIWIALVACLIAVGALSAVTVLWRRLADMQQRLDDAEARVGQIGQHFSGLTAGAVGQGRNLAKVQQDLGRLRDRLEQVASHEPGGAAFEQAIRMARKGMSASEIMEACGLSRMEADLVVTLHREGGPG